MGDDLLRRDEDWPDPSPSARSILALIAILAILAQLFLGAADGNESCLQIGTPLGTRTRRHLREAASRQGRVSSFPVPPRGSQRS